MPKKVLITGATGDTGSAAVREAIALGLDVRAMVRKIDERSAALAAQGAEVVVGDLFDIDSIRSALDGVEAAYFVYPVAPGLITATVNFAADMETLRLLPSDRMPHYHTRLNDMVIPRESTHSAPGCPGAPRRRSGGY